MNRLIVILLVALGAVAAVRADDLRGVVTFACDEFLVVARERKPSYRGTLKSGADVHRTFSVEIER